MSDTPTTNPHLDECECGRLKRIESVRCCQCNKTAKRRASIDAARALGRVPKSNASRSKIVDCKCSKCGVECRSSIGKCKDCRRKEYSKCYYKEVNEISKTVDISAIDKDSMSELVRRGIDAITNRESKPCSEYGIEMLKGDLDLSFSKGLMKRKKAGNPWRCKGCGGMIDFQFTRCVKCGVEDVLRRANAEQSLFEITL